jgi:hypothetical protein
MPFCNDSDTSCIIWDYKKKRVGPILEKLNCYLSRGCPKTQFLKKFSDFLRTKFSKKASKRVFSDSLSRDAGQPSAADILDEPIVVARATGVIVVSENR